MNDKKDKKEGAPTEASILDDIPGLGAKSPAAAGTIDDILAQVNQGGSVGSVVPGTPGAMTAEIADQVKDVIACAVKHAGDLLDTWLNIHNMLRAGEKTTSEQLNFYGKTRIDDIPIPGHTGTTLSLMWTRPPRGVGKSCTISMDFQVPVVSDDGQGLREAKSDILMMVAAGTERTMPARVGDGWINGAPITQFRLQLQQIADGVGQEQRRAGGGGTRKAFKIEAPQPHPGT